MTENKRQSDVVAEMVFQALKSEEIADLLEGWHQTSFACTVKECRVPATGKAYETTAHRKVRVGQGDRQLSAMWVSIKNPIEGGVLQVVCQHHTGLLRHVAGQAKVEELLATGQVGGADQKARETAAWRHGETRVAMELFVPLEQVLYRIEQLARADRDDAAKTALARENELVTCAISGESVLIRDAVATVTYTDCSNFRTERGRLRWDQSRGFVLEELVAGIVEAGMVFDDTIGNIVEEVMGRMTEARVADELGHEKLIPVYFRRDLAKKLGVALLAMTGKTRWTLVVTDREQKTRTIDRVFEPAVRVVERIARSDARNDAYRERVTIQAARATTSLKDAWGRRNRGRVVESDDVEAVD